MINKNFLLIIFFILLITIGIFNSLQAEEKPVIALLDFASENTQETYARAVRNLFEVSLYKTGNFSIIERNKIESILKEQGFQMTGCTDTSCAVQIGKILSANMVVIGSLNKLGKYTVTAKFINIGEGRIELADSETAEAEDDIQKAVNVLANRMTENIMEKQAGTAKQKPAISRIQEQKKENAPEEISAGAFNFSANGSYLLPIGRLAGLVESGYGASAKFGIENLFIQNSLLGIEAGYWYFPGKQDNVDYCAMIPAFVTTGYRFNILNAFYALPKISAGASYNTMNWDKDGSSDGTYKYTKANEFESTAKAGLGLGYALNNVFSIYIGTEYCAIFEKKTLGFLIISGGIDIRF